MDLRLRQLLLMLTITSSLWVMPACGQIVAGPVKAAIEHHDLGALDAIAEAAPRSEVGELARGAALSARHQDRMAEPVLRRISKRAPAQLRAAAYVELSKLYIRQSRFRQAFRALSAAAALTAEPFDLATHQTLAFAKALQDVEPMRVRRFEAGTLPIRRDAAGLARVTVGLNNGDHEVVIDTGAGFSTITRSLAERLGVVLLPDEIEVASGSLDSVKARAGVLETLHFGNVVISNVVLIVVPDEALTFAGGAYTIDAIIGLPVFLALKRLDFARTAAGETLGYGREAAGSGKAPNMLLDGVEPIVLLATPGAVSPLRLFIDTGGAQTLLYASALKTAPILGRDAVKEQLRLGGAGGQVTDEEALKIPTVELSVRGKLFRLTSVSVMSKSPSDRDGAIGQDLLRQGSGFSLDFQNMQFDVALGGVAPGETPAVKPVAG
ncbi:hypothetical protein EHI45_16385 [Rhizobium leguminosarum]|uniref:retropepsin-like aspartic protease n=1 Tax=Rhizobium leguminosarum TaxID=384 RepID=UPI000FEC6B60|nr:retropepsin-like aspartic protease [Rhizobium leguminosarum]RWX12880.1 hypothetical protein EHI45_16385 [Rhizobium leguminosarum]